MNFNKEYLVSVDYFNGWWRERPNKWTIKDRDFRLDFPDRIPLCGCYNGQDTMNAEIRAASAYGVDNFIILWYPCENEHPECADLNAGVADFMASPECGKMSFSLELCNHPPFNLTEEAEFERCVAYFITCFKHRSYLYINHKAVVKIHSLFHFIKQSGGVEAMHNRINKFRHMAKTEGIELLVSAGVASRINREEISAANCFDFVCSYADVPDLEQKKSEYSYRILAQQASDGRKTYAEAGLPYSPYVMAGWNPRPWKDPRPAFKPPSRNAWNAVLKEVKNDLDTLAYLRIPDGKNGVKAFNIYAWNEYGEGGILAPSCGKEFMMLEEIKNVFREV